MTQDERLQEVADTIHRYNYPTVHEQISDANLFECAREVIAKVLKHRLDRLPIGQRVFLKDLNIAGWIYERGMPERGTSDKDMVYGVRLDKVAFPKNFVATEVWHCNMDNLTILEGLDGPDREKRAREIVLEIRQYLCNTEFAPEPFRKPIDPNKLTIEFPDQILALFGEEEIRKQEVGRLLRLVSSLMKYGGNEQSGNYNQALLDVEQALKSPEGG